MSKMPTQLKAVDFEILRNVVGGSTVALAREPIRVATLIHEADFMKEHLLVHHKTVFLEDRMHDWDWSNGKLRYYSRVAGLASVLVVYAEESVEMPAKFDPMTGAPLAQSQERTRA